MLEKILDKKTSLKQGQENYKKIALKYENYYKVLLNAQNKLPNVPDWEINLMARLLSLKPIGNLIFNEYEKI